VKSKGKRRNRRVLEERGKEHREERECASRGIGEEQKEASE
jgi:hypothetical protein